MSEWDFQQEKSLRRWINSQLNSDVENISSGLQDGLILMNLVNRLIEQLPPTSNIREYKLTPVHQKPVLRIQKVENVAESIEFIRIILQLNTLNISADNIVDGNLKLTLGLVWTLYIYSTSATISKALSNECNSYHKIKSFLKDWINLIIRKKGGGGALQEITNFDRDWSLEINRPDLILAAILEYYLGATSTIDYLEMETNGKKIQNLNKIFGITKVLGIPQLADTDDFLQFVPDEKGVVIYLLEWLKAFELEDEEYDQGEVLEDSKYKIQREIKQPIDEIVKKLESAGTDETNDVEGDSAGPESASEPIVSENRETVPENKETVPENRETVPEVGLGIRFEVPTDKKEQAVEENEVPEQKTPQNIVELVLEEEEEEQEQQQQQQQEGEEEAEVVLQSNIPNNLDANSNNDREISLELPTDAVLNDIVSEATEDTTKSESSDELDSDLDIDLEEAVIEENVHVSVKFSPMPPSKSVYLQDTPPKQLLTQQFEDLLEHEFEHYNDEEEQDGQDDLSNVSSSTVQPILKEVIANAEHKTKTKPKSATKTKTKSKTETEVSEKELKQAQLEKALAEKFSSNTKGIQELLSYFSAPAIDNILASLQKCFSIIDNLNAKSLELFSEPVGLLKQLQDSLIRFDCFRPSIRNDLESAKTANNFADMLKEISNLILVQEEFSMVTSMGICTLASEFLYVEESVQDKIQQLPSSAAYLPEFKKEFQLLCSSLEAIEDFFQNLEMSKSIAELKDEYEELQKYYSSSLTKFNNSSSLKQELTKSYSDFSIYNSDNSEQSSIFDQ